MTTCDANESIETWCIEVVRNALAGNLFLEECPIVIPDIGARSHSRLDALSKSTQIILDSLIGAPNRKLSIILLNKDYMIRGAIDLVPNLTIEDSEYLWLCALSAVNSLQFPSGKSYPQLPNLNSVEQLYDRLLSCKSGNFRALFVDIHHPARS